MLKPKKKRKGDSAQVAYSVMQDIIRISGETAKRTLSHKRPKKPKR